MFTPFPSSSRLHRAYAKWLSSPLQVVSRQELEIKQLPAFVPQKAHSHGPPKRTRHAPKRVPGGARVGDVLLVSGLAAVMVAVIAVPLAALANNSKSNANRWLVTELAAKA